jgi:hypothetical protein
MLRPLRTHKIWSGFRVLKKAKKTNFEKKKEKKKGGDDTCMEFLKKGFRV